MKKKEFEFKQRVKILGENGERRKVSFTKLVQTSKEGLTLDSKLDVLSRHYWVKKQMSNFKMDKFCIYFNGYLHT